MLQCDLKVRSVYGWARTQAASSNSARGHNTSLAHHHCERQQVTAGPHAYQLLYTHQQHKHTHRCPDYQHSQRSTTLISWLRPQLAAQARRQSKSSCQADRHQCPLAQPRTCNKLNHPDWRSCLTHRQSHLAATEQPVTDMQPPSMPKRRHSPLLLPSAPAHCKVGRLPEMPCCVAAVSTNVTAGAVRFPSHLRTHLPGGHVPTRPIAVCLSPGTQYLDSEPGVCRCWQQRHQELQICHHWHVLTCNQWPLAHAQRPCF